MRSPLALALGLLIGTAAVDVAAQDTWRGEQRLQQGQRGGDGDRGASRQTPDYGGRTQRDGYVQGNAERGSGYWDRAQERAGVPEQRQHPRYDGGRGDEGRGFQPGYRGYDRPDYTSQHRDRGHDRDDKHRWDSRNRWDDRGLPSHRRDWDRHRYEANRYRHDDWRGNWRHNDWRRNWYHGWSGSRYRAPVRYAYPHGYSYYRWTVGYRLPSPFLVASYYVDYHRYGLAPPPYGCRWLRVDSDLLLVELVSGEIVDVLYNFYY